MKKTLGGDRIGSGKRMTFDTKTFNRSTHNLSEIFRSTMSAGTLVPFLVLPTQVGDTIDIDLDCDIRTLPTIGPLFGSYKVQLDVYQIPNRLYMRDLQMNKLEIGKDMSVVKFPLMEISANDISVGLMIHYTKDTPWGGKEMANCQIEPSTIMSYLGVKGLGQSTTLYGEVTRRFNAIPWLMYWDIFKQYYANKMEEEAYYIHNSMATQDSLLDEILLITNNEEQTINVNTPELFTVSKQIVIKIEFSNYENYAMFLEEEFVLKGQEGTEIVYWKGLKDWNIQRNDSQLTIYYELKRNLNPWTEVEITLTAYSDVEFDYIRPNLAKFELKNIDKMRDAIMTKSGDTPLVLQGSTVVSIGAPYSSLFVSVPSGQEGVAKIRALQCKQEGLAVKTYQSDINNNWLNTEWIEGENGVNAVTSIQVDEDGKFTLDEFNIKKKVYDMLNHIAASGGTYDDWQDVVWGIDRIRQISSPVYEGGLSKEMIFQEVISNSASEANETSQPLGTLAGRGVLSNKHKGGKLVIKTNEPSYVIGIVSITPRIDYSTGNEWHTNLKNMGELHNPYLDAIGYQDLITDTMAFWDTKVDATTDAITFKSAGKQPSWINYQTSKNKVFGNFALQNEQMFMVLNRRYEADYNDTDKWHISDVTTYIDPQKFNHIFADTSPDAQNFWVQISADITARRVMSANQIPNL